MKKHDNIDWETIGRIIAEHDRNLSPYKVFSVEGNIVIVGCCDDEKKKTKVKVCIKTNQVL